MKKIFSLFLALCLVFTAITAFAEVMLELNPLKHEVYLRGETVVVSGTLEGASWVNVALSMDNVAIYLVAHTRDELANGIEIHLGTNEYPWVYGTWTITVQNGDARETMDFELAAERDEEETQPTTNSSSSSTTPTVTAISFDPSSLQVEVGDSATAEIITTASSLSVEVADSSVVSASISGKTLTVKGLKIGSSDIWVRTSNNYAVINASVIAAQATEAPTEAVTQAPTEAATEATTEAPTEAPTESATSSSKPSSGNSSSGNSSSGNSAKDEEDVTEAATEPESTQTEASTEKETEKVSFSDTKGHWAEEDINYLASLNIINGMGDGLFAPEQNVTRAQFVQMLKNALGFTSQSGEEVFDDVHSTDWYFDAVNAAYENNIAQGSFGSFAPNALVTRQDMAVFAYRAMKAADMSLPTVNSPIFVDNSAISPYASDAVYIMKTAGIINGMTDITFEPMGNATRAQAARIIAGIVRRAK